MVSNLFSNHLSSLSPDVFTSLTSLRYLDSPSHFIVLRSFHHLSFFWSFQSCLSSNSLHFIHFSLHPCSHSLFSNSLVSLPSGLFSNLNKLRFLSFPFINPPFSLMFIFPFFSQFSLSHSSTHQLHHLPPFWCVQWAQQSLFSVPSILSTYLLTLKLFLF